MIDPRPAIVDRRLAGVRSILAVASGKGGVGKSACSVIGALALAQRGLAVGLLDLDFQGASCHTLIGCSPGFPAEDRGLLPLEPVAGLGFATIASFTGERPAAMRGADLAGMLLEMLAVTRWGPLDVLLVDMPPGIHDTALELARLVPRCRHLVVTTRSRVAAAVSSRLLQFLREAGAPVVGLFENMAAGAPDPSLLRLSDREGIPFLGTVPHDPSLEAATGSPGLLVETAVARSLVLILIRALDRDRKLGV